MLTQLMDSNETGGLIRTNIIWSHVIVRYTTEDSFMLGDATKCGGGDSEAWKPRSLNSAGKPSPFPSPSLS